MPRMKVGVPLAQWEAEGGWWLRRVTPLTGLGPVSSSTNSCSVALWLCASFFHFPSRNVLFQVNVRDLPTLCGWVTQRYHSFSAEAERGV